MGASTRSTSQELWRDIGCPASIAVEEHLTGKHEGWEEYRDTRSIHRLASLRLYEGHPRADLGMAPLGSEARGHIWRGTWPLSPPTAAGYWVACAYALTDIVMTHKLDPDLRECEVLADGRSAVGGFPEVKKARCR
jgi:hypothetical protein